MSINPFDRMNLGFEDQFGARTLFYHLHPSSSAASSTSSNKLVEEIEVPVLAIKDGEEGARQSRNIELGTVVVVVLGFIWVLWKLGSVFGSEGVGRGRGRRDGGERVERKKER